MVDSVTYEEVKKMVSECGLNITSEFHEECMEKVLSALEKQIPKKPIRGYTCKANNDSWRSCPECHARQWDTHKYCSQCGQAIDWSE